MTAGRSDRGPVKIRRRGRHAAPTQVEKVAQQAGRAAPAVAIAGALVAAPQASHALAASAKPLTTPGHATAASTAHATAAHATAKAQDATLDSASARAVTVATTKSARHAATAQPATYRVHSGDTLSGLATRFFHNDDWEYLYHANEKTVSNPNLIYVGQTLVIPASAPAHYTLSDYVPRHAKPAGATAADPVRTTSTTSTASSSHSASQSAATGGTNDGGTLVAQSASQGAPVAGQYSCSSLESLWEQAGGNPADAFMAAEIAMAESGGNPNAISPTDDFGLWQINASNGALATLDPFANAKSAVILSDDGTNWSPWTTFTSGAYAGRC